MDGLGGVFSKLIGALGGGTDGGGSPNWMKMLTGGMFGAGEIGNIMEQRKRLAYQNFVMDLLAHPEKLAAMAAKIQQPLSQGLQQSVGNKVQADMAQRGLSQAPGIFAATESQALAPFYEQNQQTAMDAVMKSLGLPSGTFGQPANTSGALQQFLKSFSRSGGGGDSQGGGITYPGPWNPDPGTTTSELPWTLG